MKKQLKNLIFRFAPTPFIQFVKQIKKKRRNKTLEQQAQKGGYQKTDLVETFQCVGIKKGDVVLVHAALSKIGYVDGGPKTVVDALLEVVGEMGHVLMPNSPNNERQLDYIQTLTVFDVNESPSRLGALTEYFRKLPQAKRSKHPTEPVSCIGPDASYFVDAHFGELTPYTSKSPFYRVAERGGKILMIGVTLDNAGTNLHCLEDAVDFKFPVYYDKIFDVNIRDEFGKEHIVQTKVHNPVWSAKRKCDALIPLFEKHGVLQHVVIGEAKTLLIDAKGMLDVMIKEYRENGVTMYGGI
jgi:aminoglycoside 3-N-acetyltransferase